MRVSRLPFEYVVRAEIYHVFNVNARKRVATLDTSEVTQFKQHGGAVIIREQSKSIHSFTVSARPVRSNRLSLHAKPHVKKSFLEISQFEQPIGSSVCFPGRLMIVRNFELSSSCA